MPQPRALLHCSQPAPNAPLRHRKFHQALLLGTRMVTPMSGLGSLSSYPARLRPWRNSQVSPPPMASRNVWLQSCIAGAGGWWAGVASGGRAGGGGGQGAATLAGGLATRMLPDRTDCGTTIVYHGQRGCQCAAPGCRLPAARPSSPLRLLCAAEMPPATSSRLLELAEGVPSWLKHRNAQAPLPFNPQAHCRPCQRSLTSHWMIAEGMQARETDWMD